MKVIKKNTYLIFVYTIFFFICCIGVFLPFIRENKGLIWAQDGLYQTFTAMVYIGDLYKTFISEMFSGKFTPVMMDFNIGLGYDVLTTFHYYGLGDPLLLLTVFFSKDNMYLLYYSLVILRLFLSGFGFILFCLKMERGRYQVLVGALVYVFSGYAIAAGERHPYFLNAMIYLPFLLIGVEDIINKKKSSFFTIMVFISLVSNFYFFYMLTIMVFIYGFIRFFDVYRTKWKENIVSILFQCILRYFVGVLLAGFMLIPTIYAFLNNARGVSKAYNSGIIYNLQYYVKFIYGFFSPVYDINGNFTLLGYAPICLILIIYLFFYKENKKKYLVLKYYYILGTLMLFTPLAGYIMNGMSYSSNRWVFGYSFLTAFVIVSILDDFLSVSVKRLLPIGILASVFFIIAMINQDVRETFSVLGPIFLVLTVVLFGIITKINKHIYKYRVLIVLTMVSLVVFGYYKNAPFGMNFSKQFITNGEEINLLEKSPLSAINDNQNTSFYRIGSYGDKIENQSLILQYNGTSSYYSLVDANVVEYLNDMEITTIRQPHRFYGMDARTYLEALASVKYQAFEEGSGDENRIPYGYEKIDNINSVQTDNKRIAVYQNKYVLPIGYTYDKKISKDYYNKLNSIEKQQAMLQAVVVDSVVQKESKGVIEYSEQKLDYRLSNLEGVIWDQEKGTLKAESKNSNFSITFDALKDCETYIRLEGLDIERAKENSFIAKIESGNVNSKLYLTNSNYRWDLDRENYLINLGHNNSGETTCTITIGNPGEFKLANIEIYSLPMINYVNQVAKLKDEALTNVKIKNNKVIGEVEVSKNKILSFGILYNKGWKLKIDGEKADLYKVNIMYMATDIEKGKHVVELNYQTPGQKIGLVVSIGTSLILLINQIYKKIRKKLP